MYRFICISNPRWAVILLAVVGLLGAVLAPVAAQVQVDSAFSDTLIHDFSYPEVTFGATGEYVGYLDFMQPPDGLDEATATRLALDGGSNDLVQPDWFYAGGGNAFELGVPVSFIIFFEPGDYQIAASYYVPNQGSEEIMGPLPLTVTSAATPAVDSAAATTSATTTAPPAAVTLEMTDELQYIVGPDPVPPGPQLWKLTNTGTVHSHHVVMSAIPDGITAEEIVTDIAVPLPGTPPATEPLFAQFTGVGYAALQSGGQTTWVEFDLAPGS